MSQDTKSAPARSGVKRREFLKVLGASGAAAASTGCFPEDAGKLIPYLVSPDQTVPGVSNYFATTCRECSAGCGVIAEVRDGRAIKLEGNPEHPVNRGALCARGQSALQGLYNPDRIRGPMIREAGAWRTASWDEALGLVGERIADARARNVANTSVFLNQHESGSFAGFLDDWLSAFGMSPHLSVDFEADHAVMEANRRAYGVTWPRLDFSSARLIVSFGADFLDGWGAAVPQQLDFAEARAQVENAPRFVYVGPRRSLTGLNADQWIPCLPGGELAIVNFLRGQGTAEAAAQASGAPVAALQQLAADLGAARPSMLLSGVRTENALELATAVAALNRASGNVGVTVRPAEPHTAFDGMARFSQVLAAVEDMRAGRAAIAFVRGANPAYALPRAANFAEAFARVPFKVSFSSFPDETTELCDVILPDLHSLESWGDAEPLRGTIGLQQPTMDPVFGGTRSTGDVLIALARRDATIAPRYPAADYRSWFVGRHPGGQAALTTALQRGLAAGSLPARRAVPAAPPGVAATIATTEGDFYLITFPSPVLGDGRGANKPWLQELPDPVSKVLWSSWVEIHPETAARLGIRRGDVVEVATAAGSIRAPAYLCLGVHPDAIAVPLGQGHRSLEDLPSFQPKAADQPLVQWGYGRYARNVGVNVFDVLPLGTDDAGGLVWTATRANLSSTGARETLISTEGSARQHGRGIAQAITLAELTRPEAQDDHEAHDIPGMPSQEYLPGLRSPVAADAQGHVGSPVSPDRGKLKGMYAPDHPSGMAARRWAMTIDLARCTGCSACVTACYAENNIPTVGAAWQNATVYAVERPGFNVARGREMNWIRLERYFEGALSGSSGEDFEARFVPMLCQHCGNAPCEPVCPVYATYQAPDGLNVQVYNRCVGTRYCSNNCPYKVRYFNWFGYGEPDRKQYAFPEPLDWQLNPDVTVRGKGVMEKCSFCVQRIREAENRAALEHREVAADEFTTACAAACPSRAIVFGDAADPSWSVAQLARDRRAYHVFHHELNTYPAVTYLKKVNHPASGAQAPAAT